MDRDGRPMFIANADGKIEQIIEPCEDCDNIKNIKTHRAISLRLR